MSQNWLCWKSSVEGFQVAHTDWLWGLLISKHSCKHELEQYLPTTFCPAVTGTGWVPWHMAHAEITGIEQLNICQSHGPWNWTSWYNTGVSKTSAIFDKRNQRVQPDVTSKCPKPCAPPAVFPKTPTERFVDIHDLVLGFTASRDPNVGQTLEEHGHTWPRQVARTKPWCFQLQSSNDHHVLHGREDQNWFWKRPIPKNVGEQHNGTNDTYDTYCMELYTPWSPWTFKRRTSASWYTV